MVIEEIKGFCHVLPLMVVDHAKLAGDQRGVNSGVSTHGKQAQFSVFGFPFCVFGFPQLSTHTEAMGKHLKQDLPSLQCL